MNKIVIKHILTTSKLLWFFILGFAISLNFMLFTKIQLLNCGPVIRICLYLLSCVLQIIFIVGLLLALVRHPGKNNIKISEYKFAPVYWLAGIIFAFIISGISLLITRQIWESMSLVEYVAATRYIYVSIGALEYPLLIFLFVIPLVNKTVNIRVNLKLFKAMIANLYLPISGLSIAFVALTLPINLIDLVLVRVGLVALLTTVLNAITLKLCKSYYEKWRDKLDICV